MCIQIGAVTDKRIRYGTKNQFISPAKQVICEVLERVDELKDPRRLLVIRDFIIACRRIFGEKVVHCGGGAIRL